MRSSLRVAALLLVGILGLALADTQPVVAGDAPPLNGIVVVIDPGHNGDNDHHLDEISRLIWIGTRWKPCNQVGTATRDGYPEHRFNWAVARRVQRRLEGLGATVYLTRPSDTGWGPCINARGRLGAKVHADLTVSIHADGSAAGNRGFFVLRPGLVDGWTDDIRGRSARLARALRDGLVDEGLAVANYYAVDGLRTRRDLGTLNFSDVPIAMVELGNMRDRRDADRLRSDAGKDACADGIVGGIRRYLDR